MAPGVRSPDLRPSDANMFRVSVMKDSELAREVDGHRDSTVKSQMRICVRPIQASIEMAGSSEMLSWIDSQLPVLILFWTARSLQQKQGAGVARVVLHQIQKHANRFVRHKRTKQGPHPERLPPHACLSDIGRSAESKSGPARLLNQKMVSDSAECFRS